MEREGKDWGEEEEVEKEGEGGGRRVREVNNERTRT
jgi:hypothetical protein